MKNKNNFEYVSTVARVNAISILQILLPDGKRINNEWVARNPTRDDHKAGSFKVNMRSGQWADFATSDRGGDLIALYAYLTGVNQYQAMKDIAEMLNISIDGGK